MAAPTENASTRQSSVSRTGPMVSGTSVSRNRMAGTASASPGEGAESGEHEVFGQKLRDQSSASRPERRANRHLPAAHRAARHQQIRQIDAGDQQERRRRAQQYHQRCLRLAGEVFPQRRHDRPNGGLWKSFAVTCRLNAAIDSFACSRLTPGFSRATTSASCHEKFLRIQAGNDDGIQMAMSRAGMK